MTRTAVALAFDATGNLALSVATRDADGADTVIDTGSTGPVPANQLAEAIAMLRAENLLVTSAQYADSLESYAAADALVELDDIQPRLFINEAVFPAAHANNRVGLTTLRNPNTIRSPVVSVS